METTSDDFADGLHADAVGIKNGAANSARKARSLIGQEVTNLIADVEELLARLSNSADPSIARVRTKIERAIESTKQAVADGASQVQRQASDALKRGDRYVHNSPWQAIGIVALAGLAVGYLTSRR
jgi:ElaB/YqjD/DUF883 family membrane-anchored ribosome-binding protein